MKPINVKNAALEFTFVFGAITILNVDNPKTFKSETGLLVESACLNSGHYNYDRMEISYVQSHSPYLLTPSYTLLFEGKKVARTFGVRKPNFI